MVTPRKGNAVDRPIARVPVERHPSDPEAAAYLNLFRTHGNQPINLNFVYALSPKLAKARSALSQAIRYESVVPRALRELTILRTTQLMGGEYEMNQHVPAALTYGHSQAHLNALANWQASNLFNEQERALLGYIDQAVRSKAEVDDKTFEELARWFNSQEIVEITMIAANYMGTAMFTNALRVRIDGPGVLAAIIS
jgi:alkylhydroperoxidase family enzyme